MPTVARLAGPEKPTDNAGSMATVESTPKTAQISAPSSRTAVAHSDNDTDDLPLFRFGLRQLFWFVAGISAIFAALASSHGVAAAVMLLAILVIIMHIFATALGSRLRERADRINAFEKSHELPIEAIATATQRFERLAAMKSDPRSPWHARGTTALPWLRRLVIIAIACGGVAGAVYLAITIGYRTSPAGVIVGGLSVAVLFGWIAFITGSFYGVFRHGFREAVAEQQKQMPRDW
jgi:hypothetical protein